jgi:hypothetical protein
MGFFLRLLRFEPADAAKSRQIGAERPPAISRLSHMMKMTRR